MVMDSWLLTRSLDRKQLNLSGWIQVVSVDLLWAFCNLKIENGLPHTNFSEEAAEAQRAQQTGQMLPEGSLGYLDILGFILKSQSSCLLPYDKPEMFLQLRQLPV